MQEEGGEEEQRARTYYVQDSRSGESQHII